MDEKDAWNTFLHSGSVTDYLRYRAILRSANGDTPPKEQPIDEVQNQGSDTPTTEYR